MKKLLLFLLTLVMSVGAWAVEVEIYSTSFEASDFTATTTYNDEVEQGPIGKKWKTLGTVTTNDKKTGSNGLQMRVYTSQTKTPYAQTQFDLANITKVDFSLRTEDASVCKSLTVQYSLDSGSTWENVETINATTSWEDKSVTIPKQSQTMRIKFVLNYTKGTKTKKITIDDVTFYTEKAAATPVTGVSLNKNSLNMFVGDKEALTATISPADADNKNVTWKSSNTSVATVSNEGVVSAVSVGSTTITVTTVDGNFTSDCNVTVTAIPVTGISLDRTTASIEAGEHTTLTATIVPANAANKNVTWTSSNNEIATVADGVVNAITPGSATITATTEDGNYTATCVVTVTASNYRLAYTLDFTKNDFKLPTSAQKGKEGSYTYDDKTITLYGDASNGFKFSSNYLILGKNGAYIKLPSFDFPVGKIVVVGNSGASASTAQNIFVGNTAVSTATTGSVGANTYIIKSGYEAPNTEYTLKITSAHNAQITSIKIYQLIAEDITITEAGYATYYNKAQAIELPEGLEGCVANYNPINNELEMTNWYDKDNNVVPANEPILLRGNAGTYNIKYTTCNEETLKSLDMNNLCGTDAEATTTVDAESPYTDDECYFYALSLNSDGDANSVGFYWRNNDGAPFTCPAHKAYLALPKALFSNPARATGFAFNKNTTTGISEINTATTHSNVIFNLAGQRVNANAKGIVIMNGKKFVK